jgi:hypothetical protein
MIGSIVLSTHQGLSYLAKSFYDAGIIDLVSIHHHTSRANHYFWYKDRVSPETLLEKCDTLLFFETSFSAQILVEAKKRKIKTILLVMYEGSPVSIIKMVDEVWSPSLLDQKYYPNSKLVQIPVDVKWRLRTFAKTFVFSNGNGGLAGRNGLHELLQAIPLVKSPAKFIIRSQVPIKIHYEDPRIDLRIGTFEDIWEEGDVFVFPESFNGLSLVLQEALASGMLVMATDRFPNNTYLPKEPLIPVKKYRKEHLAVEFDFAEVDPKDIATTIDFWYNQPIGKYSLLGKEYNEANSWKAQKEKLKMLLSR